jgi:Ca2+-binding RTX toxin-like protein
LASFSLIEDPGTGVTETVPGSNITGVDPQLGPLADNGGVYDTETQELAQTSPAVDQGSVTGFVEIDQRLEDRPFDFSSIPNSTAVGADGSDIGAFELQSSDLPPPPTDDGGGSTTPTTAPPVTPPTCKGKEATLFARPGSLSRTLTGTNKKDVIVGTTKKDTISAKGGNDLVCAKGGKDTLKGGGGKDRLFGQGGKDLLLGGAGKDLLSGGGKNDTCVGGAGRDTEKSC